jgi:hypothetical protein
MGIGLTPKVLAADAVLLIGEFWVLQDLAWRSTFAAAPHLACGMASSCAYSASLSYSILIQFFTMVGDNVSLTSPPTLDWVQLLAFALVALNGWYLFTVFKSRTTSTQPG